MNTDRKRVLLISYYFPPAGGPGVQRVLKFVKCLRQYDWQPIVLTVRAGDFPARDESLMSDVPNEVPVYRVPAVEPYDVYRRLTGKQTSAALPVGLLAKGKSAGLMDSMARWIRANLFIPDARIGWILPVYRKGMQLIQRHNIRMIFSSSPPHSLQLAALNLARHTHLPWVADLRDPWTEIYYYQDIHRSALTRSIDRYLEAKVVRTAAAVTTVSPFLADEINSLARGTPIHFIPNGYDGADFRQSPPAKEKDRFIVTHIGNLTPTQNTEALWKALSDLAREMEDFERDLRLQFVGTVPESVRASIRATWIDTFTAIEDYIPHPEAVSRMQRAAVLLLIIPDVPDNRGILTGKLFEYLAAETPILLIGPRDGDAAGILQAVHGEGAIDPEDGEAMKAQLRRLYQLWKKGNLSQAAPGKGVDRYERAALTGRLADIFDGLVGARHREECSR